MTELIFKVYQETDGGYVAKTKLEKGSIITEGDTLNELKSMIIDAVKGCFFDKPNEMPHSILLFFFKTKYNIKC